MKLNFKLVELTEALKETLTCCFKLSETDLVVLSMLTSMGKATSEEIAERLKVSKTTVNNSMRRLLENALVVREKDQTKRTGRPRYHFSVSPDFEKVIKEKVEQCSKRLSSLIE